MSYIIRVLAHLVYPRKQRPEVSINNIQQRYLAPSQSHADVAIRLFRTASPSPVLVSYLNRFFQILLTHIY